MNYLNIPVQAFDPNVMEMLNITYVYDQCNKTNFTCRMEGWDADGNWMSDDCYDHLMYNNGFHEMGAEWNWLKPNYTYYPYDGNWNASHALVYYGMVNETANMTEDDWMWHSGMWHQGKYGDWQELNCTMHFLSQTYDWDYNYTFANNTMECWHGNYSFPYNVDCEANY